DHVAEGGLAQPRRAEDQDVVQRLAAAPGGLDVDLELLADGLLAEVFVEAAGADGGLDGVVLAGGIGGNQALFFHPHIVACVGSGGSVALVMCFLAGSVGPSMARLTGRRPSMACSRNTSRGRRPGGLVFGGTKVWAEHLRGCTRRGVARVAAKSGSHPTKRTTTQVEHLAVPPALPTTPPKRCAGAACVCRSFRSPRFPPRGWNGEGARSPPAPPTRPSGCRGCGRTPRPVPRCGA